MDTTLERLEFFASRTRIPSTAQCAAINQKAFSHLEVKAVWYGYKITKEMRTNRFSLICAVTKKVPQNQLTSDRKIPKRLSYHFQGKLKTILTDVVEIDPGFEMQADFEPGDKVRQERTGIRATVGVMGQHPKFGTVLTTAGHFAQSVGGKNRRVNLHDLDGSRKILNCKIVHYRRDAKRDYALLKPILRTNEAHLSAHKMDEPFYPTLRKDLNQQLFVLRRGVAKETRAVGVKYTHRLKNGSVLKDLILTEPVTAKGDSGAPLIDKHLRVWGTLIGKVRHRTNGQRYSAFMPCRNMLIRESMTLGELSDENYIT